MSSDPDPAHSAPLDLLDGGMRDAVEDYHHDLYNALTGRVLSETLVEQVAEHNAEIAGWLEGNALALVSDADIERVALGEAAQMFGQDVEYDLTGPQDEDELSRRAKIAAYFSRSPAAQTSPKAAQEQKRQALIKVVKGQIKAERDAARSDVTAPCAAARLNYCELAHGLIDSRPQQALECLETSRQLGRVVALSQQGERAVRPPEDGPASKTRDEVERMKDVESGDLEQDYADLAADIATLERRGDALAATAAKPAFQSVRNAFEAALITARALCETAEFAATIEASPFLEITSENRQVFRTAQEKYDAAVAAFDAAETGLSDAIAQQHKVQFKAFGKLCDTSGSEITRVGGDLVGGGTVVANKKFSTVPTETLDRVAAKLDALQAMGEGGQFDPVHADLAATFERELGAEIEGIVDNRQSYNDAAKRIAALRQTLASDTAKANTARRETLTGVLDQIEAKVATDVLAAISDVEAFEGRMRDEMVFFDEEKRDLDAFLAEHKRIKRLEIDGYGKDLKKVIKKFEVLDRYEAVRGDDRVHRSWFERMRGIVHYEGQHALDHALLLERLDTGVPYDVAEARRALEILRLAAEMDREELRNIETQIDAAQPGDNPRLGTKFIGFVNDLAASGKEINGRETLRARYETDAAALKRYITKRKGTLEKEAQPAFENYGVLLQSLDKRTKSLVTVADWQAFLADFRSFRDTVEDYVATNKKLAAPDPKSQQEAAEQALVRCDNRIADFVIDMARFVDFRLEPIAQALEFEIPKRNEGDAERVEMEAICAMIDQKEFDLNDFADGIADGIKNAGLTALGARLRAASAEQAIGIREEALRVIRRRRDFLDSAANARLYRDNPFDSGGPALAALAALSQAEAKLLTLIKPV